MLLIISSYEAIYAVSRDRLLPAYNCAVLSRVPVKPFMVILPCEVSCTSPPVQSVPEAFSKRLCALKVR